MANLGARQRRYQSKSPAVKLRSKSLDHPVTKKQQSFDQYSSDVDSDAGAERHQRRSRSEEPAFKTKSLREKSHSNSVDLDDISEHQHSRGRFKKKSVQSLFDKVFRQSLRKNHKRSQSLRSPKSGTIEKHQVPESHSKSSLSVDISSTWVSRGSTLNRSSKSLVPRSPCRIDPEVFGHLHQSQLSIQPCDRDSNLDLGLHNAPLETDVADHVNGDKMAAAIDEIITPCATNRVGALKKAGSTSRRQESIEKWVNSIIPERGEDRDADGSVPGAELDDELSLGAEAKMMNRAESSSGSDQAAVDKTSSQSVKAPVKAGPVNQQAAGLPQGDQSCYDRQLAWRTRLAQMGLIKMDNVQSHSSGECKQYESLEQILADRAGDPEMILSNLGFSGSTSAMSSQIPDRFLQNQTQASGISVRDYLERNPALNEYVQAKGLPIPSEQPAPKMSFLKMARQVSLLNRLSCKPKPQQDTNALPGLSFTHTSWDNSLLLHMNPTKYITPAGNQFKSILHPDNSHWRAEKGFYDEDGLVRDSLGNYQEISTQAKQKRELFKKMHEVKSSAEIGIPELSGESPTLDISAPPIPRAASPLPYAVCMEDDSTIARPQRTNSGSFLIVPGSPISSPSVSPRPSSSDLRSFLQSKDSEERTVVLSREGTEDEPCTCGQKREDSENPEPPVFVFSDENDEQIPPGLNRRPLPRISLTHVDDYTCKFCRTDRENGSRLSLADSNVARPPLVDSNEACQPLVDSNIPLSSNPNYTESCLDNHIHLPDQSKLDNESRSQLVNNNEYTIGIGDIKVCDNHENCSLESCCDSNSNHPDLCTPRQYVNSSEKPCLPTRNDASEIGPSPDGTTCLNHVEGYHRLQRPTLGEIGINQESFEMEEILSADIADVNIKENTNPDKGTLLRGSSLQSDSSGFAESLDCNDQDNQSKCRYRNNYPHRSPKRRLNFEVPLSVNNNTRTKIKDEPLSDDPPGGSICDHVTSMAGKSNLEKPFVSMVEHEPRHKMETFVATKSGDNINVVNVNVKDGRMENGFGPKVGQEVQFDIGMLNMNDGKSQGSPHPDPQNPLNSHQPFDKKAAIVEFGRLLSSQTELTLDGSDEESGPDNHNHELIMPKKLDEAQNQLDNMPTGRDDMDPKRRKSMKAFGKFLARSMSAEENSTVYIKYVSPVSSASESSDDEVPTDKGSPKVVKQCRPARDNTPAEDLLAIQELQDSAWDLPQGNLITTDLDKDSDEEYLSNSKRSDIPHGKDPETVNSMNPTSVPKPTNNASTGFDLKVTGDDSDQDKTTKKSKNNKSDNILSKLVKSTAATGMELTQIDPDSKEENVVSVEKCHDRGADSENLESRMGKDTPTLSQLAKSTATSGFELTTIDPTEKLQNNDPKGKENKHKSEVKPVKKQGKKKSKNKPGSLGALVRSSVASSYELSRVKPKEISDDPSSSDSEIEHPDGKIVEIIESGPVKLIKSANPDLSDNSQPFPVPIVNVEEPSSPSHESSFDDDFATPPVHLPNTGNSAETTEFSKPPVKIVFSNDEHDSNAQSIPDMNQEVSYDTKRPSFLAADYDTLAQLVDSVNSTESEGESLMFDDAPQSFNDSDHDVSMETALSEPYVDDSPNSKDDNVAGADRTVISYRRKSSSSISSTDSSDIDGLVAAAVADTLKTKNYKDEFSVEKDKPQRSSWPIEANVRVKGSESPVSTDTESLNRQQFPGPSAPVWRKSLSYRDLKYLDNLAIALAVPPSVSDSRAVYDRQKQGQKSKLEKRSNSVDIISQVGDDPSYKQDGKSDTSPISKFMKSLLHPKSGKGEKQRGTSIKKSDTIATAEDLRKRREKNAPKSGPKLAKPTLLRRKRKDRAKSEPGVIDQEELKRLSSNKKKEKSDIKMPQWLKAILHSPKKGEKALEKQTSGESESRPEMMEIPSEDEQVKVTQTSDKETKLTPSDESVIHSKNKEANPPSNTKNSTVAGLALSTLPAKLRLDIPHETIQSPADSEASSKWGVTDSDAEDPDSPSFHSILTDSYYPDVSIVDDRNNNIISEAHVNLRKTLEVGHKNEVMLIIDQGEVKEMKHCSMADSSYGSEGSAGEHSPPGAKNKPSDRPESRSGYRNVPPLSQEVIDERRLQPALTSNFQRSTKPIRQRRELGSATAYSDEVFSEPSQDLDTVQNSHPEKVVSEVTHKVQESDSNYPITVLPSPVKSNKQSQIFFPRNLHPEAASSRLLDLQDLQSGVPSGYVPLYSTPQGYIVSMSTSALWPQIPPIPNQQTEQPCPLHSQEQAKKRYIYKNKTDACSCMKSEAMQLGADCETVNSDSTHQRESGICQHKVLCHLLKRPTVPDLALDKFLGEPPTWSALQDMDSKQHLLNEVKLLQHALQKYKLELKAMEVRSSAVYKNVGDMLTPQERLSAEALQGLRDEIYKEVREMEGLLDVRLRDIVADKDLKTPLPVTMTSISVIQQMIELLKEQVYHSSVVSTVKEAHDATVPTLTSRPPADRDMVSDKVPSGGHLMQQLSLLQRQIEVQNLCTAKSINTQLKELRTDLVDEIRHSVHAETQQLRLQVQSAENQLTQLSHQNPPSSKISGANSDERSMKNHERQSSTVESDGLPFVNQSTSGSGDTEQEKDSPSETVSNKNQDLIRLDSETTDDERYVIEVPDAPPGDQLVHQHGLSLKDELNVARDNQDSNHSLLSEKKPVVEVRKVVVGSGEEELFV